MIKKCSYGGGWKKERIQSKKVQKKFFWNGSYFQSHFHYWCNRNINSFSLHPKIAQSCVIFLPLDCSFPKIKIRFEYKLNCLRFKVCEYLNQLLNRSFNFNNQLKLIRFSQLNFISFSYLPCSTKRWKWEVGSSRPERESCGTKIIEKMYLNRKMLWSWNGNRIWMDWYLLLFEHV